MSNPEWVITLLLPVSSLLFALGGGIWKGFRRFILPVILTCGAYLLGISLVRCLIALPLMIGALSLGYGENHSLLQKTLTILALGLCLLPLANGANALLTIIIPLVFGVGYYLSLRVKWFTHKLLELSVGFSMGGVVVLLALSL